MKKAAVGWLAMGLLAFTACGSSFSCTSDDACGNPPSSTGTSTCQAITAGICGSAFTALGTCESNNSTCENNAPTLATGACTSEESAFASCCSSNPSACQSS